MNYSNEMGPKLTAWAVNKIKRDYPGDVALLIGLQGCAVGGDGHGECFDHFVPATERGYALEQEIKIAGINHDLYPRDWARCERTASLEDSATFCLAEGEILYSRSPEDVARFEALRQQLKKNLANPQFVYRKALELLDDAMNLYRNMMFEERLYQVRLAAGYVFRYLLNAALYLDGTYSRYHQGPLTQAARCKELPGQFEAYYNAWMGAKTTGELKSIAHLVIQSTRKFIAERRPAAEEPAFSTNYSWLAAWYSEMSLTWRRLRFYCEQGNADAALEDACLLQNECNEVAEEFGLPEMDILGSFDLLDLVTLSARATKIERDIVAYLAKNGQIPPKYDSFEDFLEKNP